MIFVHALGTAHIETDGADIHARRSALSFSLLLYLAVERGRRVPRATLQALLFPEKSELSGQHSLRELIYRVRQQGIAIATEGDTIALPARLVQSDVAQLLERDRPTPTELQAIEGGLLPGFAPTYSEAFTEWLDRYRAKTSFELRKALLREIERAKRMGDWTATEGAARACLALEPLNEDATLALAEVLTIVGEKVAAIGVLDAYITSVRRSSPSLAMPALRLKRRIGEFARHSHAVAQQLPFGGRASEMSLLNERFLRATRGIPQCVALHGEAGIGKSRLVAELSAQALLAGSPIVRTACQPHERARPMGAFVDLVPMLLRVPGALGCAPESMVWLRRLLELAAPPPDAESPPSPEAIALAVTRAIVDLVDAIASEATLVIVIEDVQWLDDVSLRVLRSVVVASARRLLVLLTTRDDDSLKPHAAADGWLELLPLAPLASGACVDVLHRASADDDTLAEGLCRWMAETSGGNPFHLESLLVHYRATRQAFAVPDKLTALVDQRVRSLSETARDVLGVVVALEKFATLARVEAALDINAMLLLRSIRELEAASMVRGGAQLEPAHWLIAESVERNTAPVTRQYTHRRIAQVLQAGADIEASPGQLWACAEHWAMAGETERSAELFSECARHSLGIGRARDAAELFIRAAMLTDGGGKHDLALEAIRTVSPATEADLIRQACALLDPKRTSDHDEAELAQLYALSLYEVRVDDCIIRYERCVLAEQADLNHRLTAVLLLLAFCDQCRLIAPVLEHYSIMQTLWDRGGADNPVAMMGRIIYHCSFGDSELAVAPARDLLRLASGSRLDIRADYCRKAGIGLWRAGRMDEALAALDLSYDAAAEAGLLRLKLGSALMLALLHLEAGDEQASQLWLARATEMADSATILGREPLFLATCSEIALAYNNGAELIRIADKVSALEDEYGNMRFTRWKRAIRVIAAHFRGDSLDANWVTRHLTELQVPGYESAEPSDFETSVIVRILCDQTLIAGATKVLEDYLMRTRRRGNPYSAALQRAISRVRALQGTKLESAGPSFP
jgi:DNA-binding SARP family transcriptional activator